MIQTQNWKWALKTEDKYGHSISLPKWWQKYKDSLIQIRTLRRWYKNYKDSHIQTRALTGVSITFSIKRMSLKGLKEDHLRIELN